MAIKTMAQAQNLDIAINQGSGTRFTGVFAGVGNTNAISVGGGGGISTGGGGKGGGTGSGESIVIAGAGDDGSDLVAFDAMLSEARPGDLITSDFMTRLLKRINVLEAAVLKLASGGDVVVPDLFGQKLSKVAAAVKNSAGMLEFGLVLDAVGTEIDPEEVDDGARLVLGQYPVPGAEVDEGTELNLFVSIIFRGQQPGGGISGASGIANRDAAPAAAAAEELQRVTDEAPQSGAGGASKNASKSRKPAAK